jgi:hypothetical protein
MKGGSLMTEPFGRAWELMKMPAEDRRYKITPKDVARMEEMREQGMSYRAISEQLMEEGIPASQGIVLYWTNAASREKQRAKNALRKVIPGTPEHAAKIVRDQAKRKENWEADPDMKLRHQIQSAIDETRADRKTIHGMTMDEAKEKLASGKLSRPNAKIPEDPL